MTTLRTMSLDDYDEVIELMKATPGVAFRDADSREATARYLQRNPGLSFVAVDGDRIVACIMSGHDGRRGYLQHLLVLPSYRRQGLANALVKQCLAALEGVGIFKSHIDVYRSNDAGNAYWHSQGWQLRDDIFRYSYIVGGNPNA